MRDGVDVHALPMRRRLNYWHTLWFDRLVGHPFHKPDALDELDRLLETGGNTRVSTPAGGAAAMIALAGGVSE